MTDDLYPERFWPPECVRNRETLDIGGISDQEESGIRKQRIVIWVVVRRLKRETKSNVFTYVFFTTTYCAIKSARIF